MSSPRHRAREVALQYLYRQEADPTAGAEKAIDLLQSQGVLAAQIKGHFDHFQVPEESRGFAAQLVAGVLNTRENLDRLIEAHSSNWKLGRMSSIDRNLLRLATYELVHLAGDIPPSVAIDEAIELSKQFGTQDSPSFINGILDAIRISEKK